MSADLLKTCELKTCEHLTAGNALFTVLHPASGERYTFHFSRPKQGREKGKLVVNLLTGPHNTADYTRVGVVADDGITLELDGDICRAGVPVSVALARWLIKLSYDKAPVPAGLEVHHAGKCLRCGRVLTVPYPSNPYRPYGLGPECGLRQDASELPTA
jgi:hypothetical protein